MCGSRCGSRHSGLEHVSSYVASTIIITALVPLLVLPVTLWTKSYLIVSVLPPCVGSSSCQTRACRFLRKSIRCFLCAQSLAGQRSLTCRASRRIPVGLPAHNVCHVSVRACLFRGVALAPPMTPDQALGQSRAKQWLTPGLFSALLSVQNWRLCTIYEHRSPSHAP